MSGLLPFAAWFNPKVKKFITGRTHWRETLMSWRSKNQGQLIWFHAASLGEFEQGRPVIERIRQLHPRKILLLTFFSPSGFEVRKDYDQVNGVYYLPIDTQSNANDFIDIIDPFLAVFIKYEVWPNYFLALKSKRIKLIMISVNFRANQRFFTGITQKWWHRILQCCDTFYTQNESVTELLVKAGHKNAITAGDTRYDRVFALAQQTTVPSEIANWKGPKKLLLAGSTWPADDEYIYRAFKDCDDWKLLIFPHNIRESQLQNICQKFSAMRWSERILKDINDYRVVVIDEIGWLSAAYATADLAWIGGGFQKGIHNTLEAAAWGVPVCFGPNYHHFTEAQLLLAANAAKSAASKDDTLMLVDTMKNAKWMRTAGAAARKIVDDNKGATEKIILSCGMN
jgi:3-deoxy-D-manno-octulosonic-acid transferase